MPSVKSVKQCEMSSTMFKINDNIRRAEVLAIITWSVVDAGSDTGSIQCESWIRESPECMY